MNNPEIKSALQTALENEIHPADIRLWPAVRQRLTARKRPLFQSGDVPMKTDFPRIPTLRRVALAALALIVVFAILFSTSQGQALAQSVLRFFVRTPGETIPATPRPEKTPISAKWVDVTTDLPPALPTVTATPAPALAVFAADCGDFSGPACSVEQIRRKVNFTIKELGNIPIGQYFSGATGGPESITLLYDEYAPENNPAYGNPNSLSIVEERWTGQLAQENSAVAASAVVEKVKIGGLPGEYYKGGFYHIGKENVARWNPSLGAETLRWVDNGIAYTLKHSFSDGIYYGQKEFVALAESMTTQPVAKLTIPTSTPDTETYAKAYPDYTLTLAAVRQQAGFDVRGPGKLPAFLLFGGATYDRENKFASILYLADAAARWQGNMAGLTLSEQLAPNPNDCLVCSFFVGESHPAELDLYTRMVPAEANLETVKIGALTGQYVEGYWHHPDGCCYVYEANYTGIAHLRWWKDGIAFDLTATTLNVTHADMIKIAESIQ